MPSSFRPHRALIAAGIVLTALLAAVACTATPTATAEPTPIVQIVVATSSDTPTPPPSDTPTPTGTLAPNEPTPTPTYTPSPSPTANVVVPTLGYYLSTPQREPPTAIPTLVPRLDLPTEIINVLLVGRDNEVDGEFRTDTMIIVSINKSTGDITMVSLPRDLYVFIPGNTMGTLNTAVSQNRYAPDGPVALLRQTILYNFGITTHYYAVVDIENFISIIDDLGGVDVPVACEFSDVLLASPELDPFDDRNYVEFYVPAGIEPMDGTTAMWYARLRKTTDDYDRSRRQQDVLRAIYYRARSLDLIAQIPQLYTDNIDRVDTNMGLGDVLQFVPLVDKIDDGRIRTFTIRSPYTRPFTLDERFPQAQIPVAETFYPYIERLFTPPDTNRSAEDAFVVEILNATGDPDMALLAAYNLRLFGLAAIIGPDQPATNQTALIDYTTSDKGSPLPDIVDLFHLANDRVSASPDAASPVDFRIVLGADYDSCPFTGNAYYPIVRPTPTPQP